MKDARYGFTLEVSKSPRGSVRGDCRNCVFAQAIRNTLPGAIDLVVWPTYTLIQFIGNKFYTRYWNAPGTTRAINAYDHTGVWVAGEYGFEVPTGVRALSYIRGPEMAQKRAKAAARVAELKALGEYVPRTRRAPEPHVSNLKLRNAGGCPLPPVK
jgi:hypothetical protein